MKFFEKLKELQKAKNSVLCVGLDPDKEKIEEQFYSGYSLTEWCKKIVDETIEFTAVYKPNIAFFAAYEDTYIHTLRSIISYIHEKGALVVLDAKRGDIGNTAKMYAKEIFDVFCADAVTINPYMGFDTIIPFLEYGNKDKGIIILCRTSNPGATQIQDVILENGDPLYLSIAREAVKCNNAYDGNRIGLVVGATVPAQLAKVRKIVGNMSLLLPGIGAQGGDVEATVEAGQTEDGYGMMINSSRGIIYVDNPAKSAKETRDLINEYRVK